MLQTDKGLQAGKQASRYWAVTVRSVPSGIILIKVNYCCRYWVILTFYSTQKEVSFTLVPKHGMKFQEI